MLDIEPSLVNAHNADRGTSLMVAINHPDPERALKMMKLLLERGADLGLCDCHNCDALLYACMHNADGAVVETLLDWNNKQGGKKFDWDAHDSRGRTALVLASEVANTPVTRLLLDKIDVIRTAKNTHPFQVLDVAITSGNEHHALEVVQHWQIEASIKHPERILDFYRAKWAFPSSIGVAADRGMLELVQVLYQLNQRHVSRAIWIKLHRLSRNAPKVLRAVPRVVLKIGMHFTDAWRWKQVRELCLERYESLKYGEDCLLASLPDDVFHQIVAFVVPPAFQLPPDYKKFWCDCWDVSVFGECHRCFGVIGSSYTRYGEVLPED